MNGAMAARSASPARSLFAAMLMTANGAARMNKIPAPNDPTSVAIDDALANTT